jgi:molybdopterin-binding protein
MDVGPTVAGVRSRNSRSAEEKAMQLCARNQLQGTVVDVTKGETTAHVRISVGGTRLMASTTNEAVDEFKLAKGMTVYAIIKASDVIVE